MKKNTSLYTIFISLVATIGGLLFGFDSGVINGTVKGLESAFQLDEAGIANSVASMLLGCAVGALLTGNIADKFGRKPIMIITAIGFTISAWGSGIATSSFEFIVYRIVGGVSVGAASVLAPTYISEVAPKEIRGRLASLQQLAIVTGIFLAFLCNYLIEGQSGGVTTQWLLNFQAWRWMFWVEISPAIIFFLAAIFIPESPRYLVIVGKIDLAKKVLKKISNVNVDQLVKEIQASVLKDRKPKITDLYDKVNKRIHPILWAGIGLSVFQQFVGINVIFYYGSVLWESVGFGESESLQINVIGGAVNILSTVLAIFLIDKTGRKPLLFTGSIIMAIALLVMAFIFGGATFDPKAEKLILDHTSGIIALIAANVYVFAFGFSWGPVVWVMLGEMFNNKIRGAALSVAAGTQWFANYLITITFPLLKGVLGWTYFFYGSCALLSALFVKKILKETKGISLEEM